MNFTLFLFLFRRGHCRRATIERRERRGARWLSVMQCKRTILLQIIVIQEHQIVIACKSWVYVVIVAWWRVNTRTGRRALYGWLIVVMMVMMMMIVIGLGENVLFAIDFRTLVYVCQCHVSCINRRRIVNTIIWIHHNCSREFAAMLVQCLRRLEH